MTSPDHSSPSTKSIKFTNTQRALRYQLPITITTPRLLLTLLILLYFTYFSIYANRRHLAFETNAFDTGVYAQPIWNFLQGHDFSVSLIEDNGPIRWATHVEPILFLIAPIYALWPDPRTLFFLQIAGLSLAAIPLFALAKRRLQNEWTALTIALAYFLMPATQAVTLFDFHAVTFAPLFLLSAIYFLDRALAARGKSFWLWPEAANERMANKRITFFNSKFKIQNSSLLYILASLFFLLALSTKEDISLHVFMIGVYLLILRRRWREGGLLIIVGLVWFYATFQIIIPAYRTAGGQSIYAAWFETLGNTPLEIALSPITAPDKVLALIFRPGSIPALLMITLPVALLPWVGLPLFGLTAPSLAFSLLSQNPTLRQLETWHYAAPMLPFVMLGAIDGLARLNYWISSFKFQVSNFKFYAIRTTHYAKLSLTIFTSILLLSSLTYHYFRGYTPLSQLFEWPRVTAHHQLGRQIAASIPPDAGVLAQSQLIPYVAHRLDLAIWNGPLDTDYDYIWFDLSHRLLPNRFNAHGELLTGMVIEPAFGVVAATDGYILLKKGAPREVISDDLFTFTEFDEVPSGARPFNATFGDTFELVAVETDIHRLATSETEPQVILYFDVLQTPLQDYQLFMYRIDEGGVIGGATDYPQPALFWWPTSRWQAGDQRQVRVNTIPWWTGDKRAFSYAIGFSRIDDPWDVSARLPIVTTDQTFDNGTLLPIAAFKRFAGLPYPQQLPISNE